MEPLIMDERCVVFASFIFFLANQNTTGYIQDQCCHQQGGGALYVGSNKNSAEFKMEARVTGSCKAWSSLQISK